MKIKVVAILLIFSNFHLSAQIDSIYKPGTLYLAFKIDTTNQKINSLYHFINYYMNRDTIDKKCWNPKYNNTATYNYADYVDWIWRDKTPAWILKKYYVKLVELDTISSNLAYFKLLVFAKNDTTMWVSNYSSVYKYYITKINGNYYLDNCKEYETKKYFAYNTKNIHFHCSPFLTNDTLEMKKASNKVDSLCFQLERKPLTSPIDYYMCSNESEMSMLCNIDIWDGRVGGITNMIDKIIICITNRVYYPHEFIHAILGYGANCNFLQEGIASYYGGLGQTLSYQDGLNELKECYHTGRCNFDNLCALKIYNLTNSNPKYAFAGAFCQYLIDTIGMKKFYELYYDKTITNQNFLEKVQQVTNKSKEEIKVEVEKIILGS